MSLDKSKNSASKDHKKKVAGKATKQDKQSKDKQDKPSRKFQVVATVIVVLVICVLGWIFITDGVQSNGVQETKAPQKEQQAGSEIPETVDDVIAQLNQEFLKENTEFKKGDSSSEDTSTVVLYSDDIEYFVVVEGPSSWTTFFEQDVATAADGDIDREASLSRTKSGFESVNTILKQYNFANYDGKKFTNDSNYADESNGMYISYMARGNTVCEVYTSVSQLSVSCGDMTAVPSVALQIEPFYKALIASEEFEDFDKDGAVISVSSTYENTTYPAYEIAEGALSTPMGSGGGFLRFYREDKGEWLFAYGGHAPPACEELDNESIRKAFNDAGCSSPSGEDATVGEYYSL